MMMSNYDLDLQNDMNIANKFFRIKSLKIFEHLSFVHLIVEEEHGEGLPTIELTKDLVW